MDMNVVEEVNYGVEAFLLDLRQSLKERLEDVENDEEDYLSSLKLGRIEDFINGTYPSDSKAMRDFQAAINEIGAHETDDLAAKISKLIFDYLQQGVTLASIGRGELASPDELNRWTAYQTSGALWHHISNEAELDESSLAGTYTKEFCWIVAMAGVNFFRNKHNVASKAIQSGFICGIGTLRLWVYDDFQNSLREIQS